VTLDNVRIVLVRPWHPGNIGAAARAMKVMDLRRLYLVRPHDFPAGEADRRAHGAEDILANATVVEDLAQAVADCRLVIGATARARSCPHPVLDTRQAGARLVAQASRGEEVAAVFGPERTGLSNEDLNACGFELRIPTSKDFRSLNLGSAVQLLAYEVFMASFEDSAPRDPLPEYPDAQALEYFYRHLEGVLDARGYTTDEMRDVAFFKLRRLLGRSRPDVNELKRLHSLVRLMARDDEG
jgi:tRNA (cytidine32/uridine32-2'-O)-methyltransferase